MVWPFRRKKKIETSDFALDQKIMESQAALLHAAVTTADAAKEVTTTLKQRLDVEIQKFEQTARIISDALMIADMGGRLLTLNPAAERLFGYARSEITVAHALFEINGSAPTPGDWSWLHTPTVHGRDKLGRRFPLNMAHASLNRPDGSASVLIVARSNPQPSVFDMSDDGLLIVHDMRVVAANRQAHDLFGYPMADLVARDVETLTEAFEPRAERLRGIHLEGHKLNLMMSTTPIQWEDKGACLVALKDVRDMRRIEQAINRRDSTVDMIVCFDPEFRITYCNATFARYIGEKTKDLPGRDIRDVFPPGERDALVLNIAALSHAVPTRRAQLQVPRDEGISVQDWLDHASFDEDGDVIEYQRVGRDITQIIQSLLLTGSTEP